MTPEQFFSKDAFATGAGIEILEARAGYARTRLVVGKEHLNAGERTQGGALFTLSDFAIAIASNMHGTLAVSTQSNINIYRASVPDDVLTAEARELYLHPKLSSYTCDITNQQGELIAQMTAQLYRKDIKLPL